MSAMQSSVSNSSRAAANVARSFENASQSSKELGRATSQGAAYLRGAYKNIRDVSSSAEEVRTEFARIQNSIAAQISDPKMRASFIRFADAQADAAERTEAFNRVVSSVGKPLSYVGNVASTLISSYQSSGSQIGTATAAMEMAISAVGKTLQGFGTAAQLAGVALSGIPLVGAGLELIGLAATAAGKTLNAVAEKVLPLLNKQLEINIAAFQGLSSSGAVFTGGLQSMINNARDAGLTLQQLDVVVKANKESLAALGEGVAGGTNRLAKVLNAGGDDFKKRLFNLGYTMEEQAGLIADVMKDMRQSGRIIPDNPQNNALIAETTKNYAENLRVIANITGEDAKAKMQQARDTANELAFQQKLAGMDEVQRQNIVNAMANMSPVMQKAFQETVVFGRAVTPAVAAFLAQSQDAQNSLNASVGAMQDNQLDQNKQLDINKQYGAGIREDMLNSTGIAMAGLAGVGGIVGQLKDIMQKELSFRQNWTTEAIDRAQRGAAGQARPEQVKNDQGQLVNQAQFEMANLLTQNQKLNAEISNFSSSTKLLEYYAKGAAFAAEKLRDGLNSLNDWLNAPGTQTPTGNTRTGTNGRTPAEFTRPMGGTPADLARPMVNPLPTPPSSLSLEDRNAWLSLPNNVRQQFHNNPSEWINAGRPRTTTPGTTVPPTTPSSTTSTPGPQSTGPINNANDALRAASLYHQGPTMPTGEELARQQAEQRQAAAEQDDQNTGSNAQQNAARNRNASANDTVTGMDRLTTAMNSVRDVLDESVRHLANIENYTKQSALNA
jgi:hypothetical protein